MSKFDKFAGWKISLTLDLATVTTISSSVIRIWGNMAIEHESPEHGIKIEATEAFFLKKNTEFA